MTIHNENKKIRTKEGKSHLTTLRCIHTFLTGGARNPPQVFPPEELREHCGTVIANVMEWLPMEGCGWVHLATYPQQTGDVSGKKLH